MGLGVRWLVAVLAALAAFGGCWLGLAAGRVWDTGAQVGVASVPLVVLLGVLGAWAERARKQKEPEEGTPIGHVSARVKRSPLGQAIGHMGEGAVVFGPGASLTNPVFHQHGQKDPGTEPLIAEANGAGSVLVVGDVPQEPAAFQVRAGLMEVLGRETGQRVSVVFAVTGIRGVGKTQVAAAYARRRIADGWRLVAWVDAGDTAQVLAGLARVAVAAGVGPSDEDARVLAAGVRHWLEADGARRLLVFDNAADLDGLRPFVPAAGAAQVVITSNRQFAAGLGTGVPVDVFTEEEALAFLAERTGLDNAAGARELATELGFLPLGLAQAAALIAVEHLRYGKYLERLRAVTIAQYLARVEGDAYRFRVAEAILLSLRAVEDADPSGRCTEVMSLVSVLAETGMSRRLMHAAARDVPKSRRLLRTAARNVPAIGPAGAAAIDAVAGRLADASLVDFSMDDSILAHRLVMRVVRERLVADGKLPAAVARAVRVLGDLADGISEAWRDPAGVREVAVQVNALTGHLHNSPDALGAKVAASLRRLRLRSAYLLNSLGDSTGQAILAAKLAAADCEQSLRADHPDALTARTNLAYAYQAAGRTAEAIPLYEQTLAARERVLGADRPLTLLSRNNLAHAYQAAGHTAKAIPLLEQTVAGFERVLGTDHRDTLGSRLNLAGAYEAAGRTAKAIPLLEQTLADFERVLGTDHPSTLGCRNSLAGAYQEAGRTAEAIPLHEQTLADYQRVLGADHPGTLGSRNNLASAYDSAGRLTEAIPLYDQTLADRERVLGPEHPDTLGSRNNLAYAYRAAGRTAEAIPLYEQTLADCERVLGPEHPSTLGSRNNLAGAYQEAGRTAEAIPLYEQTLADCERVLGTDHPSTLTSRNNLASSYKDAGRTAEAIPLLEQTLADCERVLGTDHPDTLTSRNNLASAYYAAGRTAEAIPILEQTLGGFNRVLGADHPDTLLSRNNLALAYQEAGRTAEAIALLEQTLGGFNRVLGTDHPSTLTSRHNLANAYREAGRTAEAIALLEQALADCERVLGTDHLQTSAVRDKLATLLTPNAVEHEDG